MLSAMEVYNDCVKAIKQNKIQYSKNCNMKQIIVDVTIIEDRSFRKIPITVSFLEFNSYPSLRTIPYTTVYLSTFLKYLSNGKYLLMYEEEFLRKIEVELNTLVKQGKITSI